MALLDVNDKVGLPPWGAPVLPAVTVQAVVMPLIIARAFSQLIHAIASREKSATISKGLYGTTTCDRINHHLTMLSGQ